jgi:hypothetical protein
MPPLMSMAFRFLAASSALFLFIGLRSGWAALKLTRKQFVNSIFLLVFLTTFFNYFF